MGLKDFFSKIGHGIRKGISWVANNGLGLGRKILDVARPIVDTVKKIPGVSTIAAPLIGGIEKGMSIADKVIGAGENIRAISNGKGLG